MLSATTGHVVPQVKSLTRLGRWFTKGLRFAMLNRTLGASFSTHSHSSSLLLCNSLPKLAHLLLVGQVMFP